ncbi:MAG: ABC transporter ATP-binding protein, partial [Opitutales bacterium]|nr:ABC transporter ATP-binding protein [Opitutales bacterium]
PSGCGKSTLLYLLGLLDKPESGEILLENNSMTQASEQKRTEIRNEKIGFVFQFHFLIKELTVLENVRLPILKSGKSLQSANAQSEVILEKLGLIDKLNRPAFKLSGGEQQRVAIARALSNSPRILLADEPTGNLDSSNSDAVFEILNEFAHEGGITVVMVTHNMDLAKRSDEIIRMMDGRIVT